MDSSIQINLNEEKLISTANVGFLSIEPSFNYFIFSSLISTRIGGGPQLGAWNSHSKLLFDYRYRLEGTVSSIK